MKRKSLMLTISLSALLMASCTEPVTQNQATTSTDEHKEEPTKVEVEQAPTLDELQADKDVIWMGEVMVDYALNYDRWSFDVSDDERATMEKIGFKNRNGFKILKLQVADVNETVNEDHIFIYKVLANRKKMKFYRDANVLKTYLPKEIDEIIARVDTMLIFNEQTEKEEKQVVLTDLDPSEIKAYRVRQLIYYSKKDICFKTVELAVAPLLLERDEDLNISGNLTPLFWMKPIASMTVPNLMAAEVTWAKRTYRHFDLEKVKVLKKEQRIGRIMDMMMLGIRENAASIKLGMTFNGDGTNYYDAEDIEDFGDRIDTIVTFDLETKTEQVDITQTVIDGKTIKGLRLLQDWV